MPISPAGTPISNVPNVYVQIVPPAPIMNGVSTTLLAIVGSASGGPKNAPVQFGTMQEGIQYFGTPNPVDHDLMTVAYAASMQGASNFIGVRVTDGTDTSSTSTIVDTTSIVAIAGATLSSLYTGSSYNTLKAVISAGSNSTPSVPSYKITIFQSGGIPEVFDNISGLGNSLWANLVSAINNGQSVTRPPSRLVVATLATGAGSKTIVAPGTGYAINDILTVVGGTSTLVAKIKVDTVNGSGVILTAHISQSGSYSVFPTGTVSVTGGTGTGATFTLLQGAQTAPKSGSNSFSGGTDGSDGITDELLIGTDGITRTGMYALRGRKANIVALADQTDATYWTNQVVFSNEEGLPYMIGSLHAGLQDDVAGAVTAKQTAGLDAYNFKLMHGDWCQINDPYNSIARFISPQGFMAGLLSVLRADGSSLNKQILGIIATQKSLSSRTYSDSDLSQLYSAGIDVITFGIPKNDSVFGGRLGVTTSSNNQTNTDNYPRMINFLANTILRAMADYVGRTQNPDTRAEAKNAAQSFFALLASSTLPGGPMIGDVNKPGDLSAAFSIILDSTNNPDVQVAAGFMQCDARACMFSITQYLVVNVDAAQNITIQVSPPQPN